jgi:hypothetical protein
MTGSRGLWTLFRRDIYSGLSRRCLLANGIEFRSDGNVVEPDAGVLKALDVPQFEFNPQPSRKSTGVRRLFRPVESILAIVALFCARKHAAILPVLCVLYRKSSEDSRSATQ